MDKIGGAVENQQNSLQEVMQLPILRQQFLQGVKDLITEKSLQTNDKFDWKFALEGERDFLNCIAYHSLDDAFEIAGNDQNLLLRLLHSERVYARYFDQVDSIIAGFHAKNMYNNPHAGFLYVERRKRSELKGQTQSPDQIRAIFEQYDQGSLYEKMVRYYSILLKSRKDRIDGVRMSYPGTEQEYNLEMLIDQMVKTDKRNLTGVLTSLEMIMHNQEYRDEQGNTVLITHGETALEKAKQYLHEKICSDLPKDCELKETENGWKVAYPEGEEYDERYSGLRFQEVGQMCFGIGDGYSTFNKVGKNIFKVLEQSTGKNDWVDNNFQYSFDKSYKNVKVFNNNMFAVQSKKSGMWSLVEMPDDDYEKKIWKKKYYDIEVLDENSFLVKKEVDGKRWLVDRNEKKIFHQSYHLIQKVDDDRFIVQSEQFGNMYLINRNETQIWGYQTIKYIGNDYFEVKREGNKFSDLIDGNGKIIQMACTYSEAINKETLIFSESGGDTWLRNGSNSFIRLNQSQFEKFVGLDLGTLKVQWPGSSQDAGKWCLTDGNGNSIFKKSYSDIKMLDHNTFAVKEKDDGNYSLVNRNEQLIFKKNYHDIQHVDEKIFIVQKTLNGKKQLINNSENDVFDGLYDDIFYENMHDGKIKFICRFKEDGNECQIIDTFIYNPMYGVLERTKTDIKLLNALEKNEGSERLKTYLIEKSPNQEYREFQQQGGSTPHSLVKAHNWGLHESPEQYIGIVQAKKPQTGLVQTVIDRFAPLERSYEGGGWSGSGGFGKGGAMDMRDKNEFESFGGEQLQHNLSFEHPLPGIAVTKISGSYQGGKRRALHHGYTKQMSIIAGEEKKNRGVLSNVNIYAGENIVLPVTINQTQIIQAYALIAGNKIPLEINTKANGITTVIVPEGADSIEREIEQGVPTGLIPSITIEQYKQFRKQYIAEYGTDSTFDTYELLPETAMFLDAIKHLAPRDKIIMCEQYVRDMMWYDDENRNSNQKSGKPLDIQLQMCSSHRVDLINKHPEVGNKLYVGVCEDASHLLLIMLRKLGFISGKIRGIAGGVGHGWNFVIMPGEKGTLQMIELDGTPSNYSEYQPETIQEREERIREIIENAQRDGKKIETTTNTFESTELLLTKQKKHLEECFVTLEQLIEMYAGGTHDELVIAAIEQKITQLPEEYQAERREKWKEIEGSGEEIDRNLREVERNREK